MRKPYLDVLRGLAILMVVAYHGLYLNLDAAHTGGVAYFLLNAMRMGWLGVQLFFVLSGYLITGILLETRERPDYYQRFYKRRALRILPAYGALLVLLSLTPFVGASFLVASTFFGANLVALWGIPLQYGPLWSLAVEEQFYLLWPTAVRHLSRTTLRVIAVGIVLGVLAARYQGSRMGITNGEFRTPWFYTWFVADGLAIGALVRLTRPQVASLMAAIGIALLVVGYPGILSGTTLKLLPWELLFASAVSWAAREREVPRALRGLTFLGEISYGLYLIHWLVILTYDALVEHTRLHAVNTNHVGPILLRFAVIAGVSIGIATLSRFTFEAFFLQWKDRTLKVSAYAAR